MDDITPYLHKACHIVAADNHQLLAIYKKENVLTHPNTPSCVNQALCRLPYDFDQQGYCLGEGRYLFILNRLDSPVSGLLLATTQKEVAESVRRSFKDKLPQKHYWALVKGFPVASHGRWRSRLQKQTHGKKIKMHSGKGEWAETQFERLFHFKCHNLTLSLLKLLPVTGRTHQLRIHCAENHLPIVGDATYGDVAFNNLIRKWSDSSRLCLHSYEISVPYTLEGRTSTFHSSVAQNLPYPELLEQLGFFIPKKNSENERW